MFKRTLTAAAAVLIGAGTSIGTAAPASACVWDLAWFFLHQCHAPPAAPAPEGPSPPLAPLVACDRTHCGPDVPIPCYGPGSPC